MTKFLYFIPGRQTVADDAKVKAAGLEYAVLSRGGRGVVRGPDGGPGCVLCDDPAITGYFPEKQRWRAAAKDVEGVVSFWVGMDNENPPTPETLARTEQLDGPVLTFRDGRQWKVPVLRQWHPGDSADQPAVWTTTLPSMIDINDYGIPTEGNIVPEYRDLFDIGLQVLAKMVGGQSSLTTGQMIQFAADCLGANYQVGLLELSSSMLDCLSTDDARKVIEVAIDLEGYGSAVKNWDGRQVRPDTDSDSGSVPPTPDEATHTEPVSAS